MDQTSRKQKSVFSLTTAQHTHINTLFYITSFHVLQNLTLQTVVSVLNSTKGTEIPQVLKSVSEDAQDTLMKYIYKGMGMPGWGDVSGSVLLAWHEKVSIVRFLGLCN